MPEPMLFLLFGFATFMVGLVGGRWYGLYRHSVHQANLAAAVDELEVRILELNEQLAVDPLHAAVVHGQTIVIHQIERLLKDLKEAIA